MAEVNSDELKRSRPGATIEKSENPAMTGKAGLYRHKFNKDAEIATKWDPLYGDVQSEALIRTGEWERVGDVPTGYAKEMVPGSIESEARADRAGATIGEVKGINARLDAVETRNTDLEAKNAELLAQLAAAKGEEFPGQEQAKTDAAANVESGASTGEAEATSGTENTSTTIKSEDKKGK